MALQFSDELKQIWESEVKGSQQNGTWMILTEEPKGTVEFVSKGAGGYDEFVQAIADDTKVYFGALRVTAVDDDSRRTKFIYVVWIGPKVPPLKRASFVHDKKSLEKRLQAATGAHKPKGYEWN